MCELELFTKSFTVKMRPSTYRDLRRAVGRHEAETGERLTVSGLINSLIDKYLQDCALADCV